MTFQNRGENQLENLEDLYELSPMQQGMLFHSIYSPNSGDYFEQSLFTIKGDLNFAAFEGAWRRVLDRYPILRTSFLWEDLEKPLQVVYRQVDLPLERHDWRNLSTSERELQLQSFMKKDRSRGFLLSNPPLMRLALFQFAEDEYKFLFSRHHLLIDRWSRALLLKDLFATYHALSEGKEPSLNVTRPYVDYITWLARQDAVAAEQFWRNLLGGFTEPTSLDIGRRPDHAVEPTARYSEQRIQLSEPATTKLTDFARQHRLTLNTLVQGAWALLLSRYTGKDDIVFGATVAGRPAELTGVESMVGLFINTLPVRVRVPAGMRLLSWLKGLQAQQTELQQFEYSSLLDIQGWSDVPRGVPLFESILVFENLPVGSSYQAANNSVEFRDDRGAGSTTGYPLTLYVNPGRRLAVKIVYDLTRYTDEAVHNLLIHLQTLFENLLAGADTSIWCLPLLTESEEKQILVDWNNTQTNFEQQRSVMELFERQASSTPSAIAVTFQDRQLTYAELNARANQLARQLRSLGVGPEIVVGIFLERSLEMVIGLLGILKAGGAYLPLDPGLPKERVAFMLEDAGAPAVVTVTALSKELPPHQAKVVALDKLHEEISAESTENLDTGMTNENLAYVIYTSGSTGKPKGVQVFHSALANFLNSMQERPGISASDVLLSVTTLSFDIAGLELYLPLTVGARVILASPRDSTDGVALVRLISQSGATIMQATPATWRLLIESGWKGNAKLRILCGGEALSRDLATQLLQRGAELWNLYGPTETTVWSTLKQVASPVDEITIGKPIANTQIYILDQQLQPVPIGIAGELHIGGKGVARGYLNRPDLTAEKFVPDPYSKGQRLYKTGDLARYLADGNIEYMGRLDDQVKIRGFRIELGEIEAVLSQHPGVRASVAVVHPDSGDDRLVAYVVPETAGVNTRELRDYLRKKLPQYMVPAAIVEIKELPLTPNGKIDRRALPTPQILRSDLETQFESPRTPTEEILKSVWSEILKVDDIGVHDNFFDLGGHSLSAIQVVSRIRVAFGTELPLAAFFKSPTIAACAGRIEEAIRDAEAPQPPPLVRASRQGDLPLSFAQQRLWFLNQLEGDSGFYNMPFARRLRGPLDIEALRKALESITMRHEALRTNFADVDGKPVQVIRDTPGLVLSVTDLRQLPDTDLEREIQRLGAAEAVLPFDLSCDPLLRVKLLLLREEDSVLLVTMHHIVSDGWSLEVLWRELAALYEEFTLGTPSLLSDLPIQYVDYSEWQREWLESETMEKQLSYWRRQLHGIPSVLELPKDRPRPAVQSYRGRSQSLVVPSVLAQQLAEFSRREGVTLFMTLLAALQTLLWRYTGQEDIVVGTPVANRNRPEIEGLIGFLTNTLVIRSNLSETPTFRELLGRVRQVVLSALANQDLPFERLVDDLQPERSLSRTPLFQVNFTLQNARPAFALNALEVERLSFGRTTSKFDLTLTAFERPNYLSLTVEYNTDLFDDARMSRMLGHYQTLLEGILANPETKIWQLPILTDSERELLIVDWNQTSTSYGEECVHELFSEQAKRFSNSTAVLFKETQLSYTELDQKANQLARFLSKRGVGAESLVGICVERSTEMIIGLLGILKAGGAYLPLDPSHPQELLSYMLADAQVSILLTQESLRTTLPKTATDVICLDSDWKTIGEEATSPVPNIANQLNLAYVIYTSGSTGRPRGVMVTHLGLANYLNWCTKAYRVAEGSGSLVHSPLGFDLTVTSLLAPLVVGQRVTLLREDEGIEELGVALFGGNDHSLVKLTPSHLEGLSHLLPKNTAGKTRALIIGGEALFGERLSFWRTFAPETKIINEYGPTETVVGCCVYEVAGAHSAGPVPIGKPIANANLYVLDEHLEPVPVGVPGELYIGGAGVARGYVNHPEITAEKFIPDPFNQKPGERLYRSGDLVRYLVDGNLEYIGRRDHQVKLRGYRIELGEVEAVLNSHPQVREAVVLAREDEPGNKQLVGYVAPNIDALASELTKDFETLQVSEWQEVFDESYTQIEEHPDPKFNIVGWNSSYTGDPIPEHEMREWVERTVERILLLQPKRVLEIGCGSGLLLSRIAPHCEHYHGTDFSQAALNYIRKHFPASDSEFANVTLSHDLKDIEPGSFDTIVINSVVQYFPTAVYLVKVLKEAVRLLKPEGSIFLGDLRSLPLQRAFHSSVQLHNAPDDMTVGELRLRIEMQMDQERELVIDPAFFIALSRQIPELAAVDIHLKRAFYPNELSKFRYDVILRVGTKPIPRVRSNALHWQRDALDLESLRRMLADERPDTLIVREVPNALLASEFKILELLDSEVRPQTVGELRRVLHESNGNPGVNPEDIWTLADELPYSVHLRSSGAPNYDSFEVILRRKDAPYTEVIFDEEIAESGQYTNNPLRAKVEQSLLLDLRKMLRQKLPEHMAPSEFVFLTTLPLTSNGKIDRAALPAPDRSRSQSRSFKEPRNDIERQLADIWAEILRLKQVGINDNFFQLGGHSLLGTQVISRVRERFKIQFPLRRLFEYPTIAELAEAVGQAQKEDKAHPELQIKAKQRDRSTLLENIDNLSAEQIDSLLTEVLSKVNANR